jgi:hypothetical protein
LEEAIKKGLELLSPDGIAKFALDLLAGGVLGWAIGKVLDPYVRVPLILETKWLKFRGKAHEYSGKKLVYDYWQDLLGEEYGLFSGAQKTIEEHHRVVFNDVVVTDFVPRAPGFYYSQSLWNNPKLAPLSLGVMRVSPRKRAGFKKLLAIHKPSEFEAHGEIEKGIPLVVSDEVYKKFGDNLQKYGSVYVPKITATMSDVGEYSDWLKMADMPYTFPVVKEKRFVKTPGDSIPIMGNGWVVYKTPRKAGFVNFRFWAGVDYHRKNLREAKEALDKLIPCNALALTDFDEKVRHWVNAPLRMSNVWKYFDLLKGKTAFP